MSNASSLLTRHAVGLGILALAALASWPAAPEGARPVGSTAPGAPVSPRRSSAAEIVTHIRRVALRHGISPPLVTAIVEAESEFNPRAVSSQGARGLMQLMPGTAARVQVEDAFDPYENVEGGVRHLAWLMERFKGDLPRVLAAYNAGEQAVLAHGGIPPYPETRRFVARILRRIGREDLAARVRGRGGLALATTTPPTPVSWSEAWRERQALEHRTLAEMDRAAGDPPRDARPSAAAGPAAPESRGDPLRPEGP